MTLSDQRAGKLTERDFRLPDLGEGLTEAELLSWRVAVGDTVTLNQIIGEVETAKAAVELLSPYAGVVLALHAEEGDSVPVGNPIITFGVPAETGQPVSATPAVAPDGQAAREPGPVPGEAPKRTPNLVGYGATSGTESRRGRRGVPPARRADGDPLPTAAATAAPQAVSSPPAGPASASPTPTSRPLAKPLVRKLARDNRIDLADVPATGPGGIVTRGDLTSFLTARTASASTAPAHTVPAHTVPAYTVPAVTSAAATPAFLPRDDAREERIPLRGVRKATAEAMVRSAGAPQVTEFLTIDITPTMELLTTLRASGYFTGVKLTPLTFTAKALLDAVPRHPTLNSHLDEVAQEIVLHRCVNLGIAAATPRGLMVPNIKDAGPLDLLALARALQQLAATARDGRATPSDLTGGTISITNIGVFGVDTGTPLLNPGEAAILGLGAVREQPWVVDGELAVRQVTTLSLTFDHRLVDGEQGSRFLADIGQTLSTG